MLQRLVRPLQAAFLFLILGPLFAHAAPATVRFSVIKTAALPVREGLLFSGGRFGHEATSNFSAFLVQHGEHSFLLDSGLGSSVAEQYAQDMPLWMRPFFKYEDPVLPARDQLARAGLPAVTDIYLTHDHWDHASGLGDFPQAAVWVSAPERIHSQVSQGTPGGAWPSQVGSPSIQWRTLTFQPVPYEGFDASLDQYGDGSVVWVPMRGHTPGSVGLFLRLNSGRRYFFVGDTVWSVAALKDASPKFWPARLIVDDDAARTQQMIDLIRAAMVRDPALVIVPAHDGTVQDALGYFPKWVE
ncbi:MAG: MBL fold metallo-hydrolase [Ramlibacter sp.]|nr:MBL fold metallo-hydrolase [Ramlibacter sp.]